MTRVLRLFALCVLSLLLGCDAHRSVTVLRFWAIGREGEVLAQLLAPFSAAHPEIEIKIEQLPWTGAHAKLLTAVAGDATPDLCQLGNTWVPELVALKALQPVDEWVRHSTIIDRSDYFDGIWATSQMRGQSYAIPWYVDTRLLFYRKDILRQAGFNRPPVDWVEWRTQMRAIQRLSPDKTALFLPLNEFEPMVALGLQFDTPLIDEAQARALFQSADVTTAMRFYIGLFAEGLSTKMTDQQISNVWTEFGRGYFAFYISGPWNITEFKKRLPASVQGQWATAPLPGPHGPGASIAGGSSLAIFKASAHPREAWMVVEYLSTPNVQERFHELTGDLPPRRSTWNLPAIAQDEYAQAFKDQLERVKPTPRIPEWEQIATELRVFAEHVVLGDYSMEEGLARLNESANRMLHKRRALIEAGEAL
jgi:multiple sugar transport system substrate-binding protein